MQPWIYLYDEWFDMAPEESKKRKQPASSVKPNARSQKRAKTSQARTILSQTSDKALNQNGELNVASFVKAREFEIKAMEKSIKGSKKVLSARAFQQVPKDMRRRTASHNVKRVPKRLRARAEREMKEDNTPTVTSRRRKPTPHQRLRLENAKGLKKKGLLKKKTKVGAKGESIQDEKASKEGSTAPPKPPKLKKDALSKPAKPPARYRKRQINKSWLPTHVWHAKRARMTEPMYPLWRFAISMSPTEKCYRPTHRASSTRGCVAWDTSYMGTICAEGIEASLLGLLRSIGVDAAMFAEGPGARWRKGTRSWHGWIRERDNEKRCIAPVTIVWCAGKFEDLKSSTDKDSKKISKRKLFIRVHPASFLQVWKEILHVSKIQRPPVMVEDLRFEIGSIEVTGPSSTEALVGVLRPSSRKEKGTDQNTPVCAQSILDTPSEPFRTPKTDIAQPGGDSNQHQTASDVFLNLAGLTNPASLPPNALLAFEVNDPRLRHPPRTLQTQPWDEQKLLSMISDWSVDRSLDEAALFSRDHRFQASRLPSQKNISRRKADAGPGSFLDPLPTDPSIPIMLLASRSSPKEHRRESLQGSWTLLVPWSCVLPVWYSLVHYPLSTGGTPRFGGLDETREVAFGRETAWFPGDFPGTSAGWAWELEERGRLKKEWERRPKGKRCEWESVNIGNGQKGEIGIGWGCDWERLFTGRVDESPTAEKGYNVVTTKQKDVSTTKSARTDQPSEQQDTSLDETQFAPLAPSLGTRHLQHPFPSEIPPNALAPVHITLLSTGHLARNARIYRLPTTSPELLDRWSWLLSATQALRNRLHSPSTPKPKPSKSTSASNRQRNPINPLEDPDQPLKSARLAHSLFNLDDQSVDTLLNDGVLKPGHPAYPHVPAEADLIGFVTSANYSLAAGSCTAVGNVAVAKVVVSSSHGEQRDDVDITATAAVATSAMEKKKNERICIVRNAGESVGRLARWRFL